MNVGSLFSGIGGLDLGLERAGMTVRWQSEIDPYASRVLARHWPDVPNLGDITTIDWSTVEPVDLICGGYPCQPFSLAGVRAGTADARHLWPHFAYAVRHLRPRYALLENVPGHLSLGFGRVLGDLADLGYDCEWDRIPAAAVGAPHVRYRIFVVAHTTSNTRRISDRDRASHAPDTDGSGRVEQRWTITDEAQVTAAERSSQTMAHADSAPRQRGMPSAELAEGERRARSVLARSDLVDHRPQPPHWWTTEPDVGRVAHGIPHRVDRLRCLGNAVVPQVAEWIGHRIMEAAA